MDAIKQFVLSFQPPKLANEARRIALPALTGSADAFLALALAGNNRITLAVTPGIPDAERLADDLRILSAKSPVRILEFPSKLEGEKSAIGARIKTTAALRAWSISPYPTVVVASYQALAQPIPQGAQPTLRLSITEERQAHDSKQEENSAMTFSVLSAKLADLGYRRVPQVESEGDFSVRGGIIDAWCPGEEYPIRAEFFGDDLESLRRFNPASQVSIERIDSAELLPVSDERGEDEQQAHDSKTSLLAILPHGSSILAIDHNEYSLSTILDNKAQATTTANFDIVYTGDPAPPGVATYDFLTSPLPGFAELGADEAHHPELFDAARKRLDQHLAAAEKRGIPVFKIDELAGGFEIASMIVVAKSDRVFAKRKLVAHRTNAAVAQGARLNDFDDIEPGEYVVHLDYGVGKYIGSSQINIGGRLCEVFTIEYADGGKLHVPAAHAHLLSRYVGVKGEKVQLHRLDGTRWEKDKKEAQRAVTDLAAALLETQARRDMVPGYKYEVRCEGREAFDAAFPYEETDDQLAAIAAIDKDLSERKPMDRLICGDAGYGKTEVAMRAAYVAVMNGRQVAVLAPTTVLAEQHFETFTSRFDGTPVRIESVSRFQTRGTHSGTFQRLATGVCDIVIGTHAILTDKICFRDLGLIIIDEEQRFGVRHKEFLKRLRATADVLTLSATPIPRTLYLSMTGARDLSLLRSPPRERVAVETRIVRDSDEIIRTAIESELLRGGQVFFLHNRVSSIHSVEKRLKQLFSNSNPLPSTLYPLPSTYSQREPRIVVAHGQMDSRTLAKKMRDFERGEYDILLSTTIIESGIDIPRANTIIISDADKFGMADLYQLRGRVGRSSKQGYAYFLLPPSGIIDSEARERLDALKRHGGLGSGFNLAVRDLEIRGAGNLLGSQQSGHIAAVGFSLYCQLLQRTIAKLKGEKVRDIVDVKLNLDFANPQLSFEYIEEDVQRMSLMKRFAEAQDVRVVKALAAEMRDRFGPPPPETLEYVHVARLRVVCAECGISNIDVKGTRAVFYKNGSRDIAFVHDLKAISPDRKLSELEKYVRNSRSPQP